MCSERRVLWISESAETKILCLRLPCGSSLLQCASNFFDDVLAWAQLSRDAVDEDDCNSEEPPWPSESFSLKLSTNNCSAVGVGANRQHRTRTARLALAVTLILKELGDLSLIREMFSRYSGTEELATEAWRAKSSTLVEAPEVASEAPAEVEEATQSPPTPPASPTAEDIYDFHAGLMAFHRDARRLLFFTDACQKKLFMEGAGAG
mmetsp:Transcript_70712/g.165827  ORF Transcript_70712/g.165827 Transcript_70712/m.165827 type:complete len:207 (+) Transcript_70712:47-667(+)